LIFRGSWVTPSDIPRFTWPGGHPLWASAEVGVGLLVIVFAGGREVGFSGPARAALAVLFGACLYLGHARTAFAGLAVAGLFGYWFVTKGTGAMRRLAGAAAIGATVVVIAGSVGGPITQYLYRGQGQQQVYALNGRLALW